MKVDALIKEKVRVQRLLAKKANYDVHQYFKDSAEFIKKFEKKYGKLKYGIPKGWTPPKLKIPS